MIFRTPLARAACAGATVLALALAGCGGGGPSSNSSSENTPATGGVGPVMNVFNGGSGQFVENYNPFSPTVLADVTGMIFEPLFFFNNLAPLDVPAVPVLGESYTWNADGTALDIVLKSGVTWSDGKPFSADDVAFTYNLVKSTPALNTTGNAPSAKATDATHVTLTFSRPSYVDGPTFLGSTYMVPKHIWQDKKKVATDPNKNPVGTGPMALSDFTPQSYLFKKNEKFRDASTMAVGGVRVYSLSGNQAATDKLLAGGLDWAGIFIPNVDKILKAKPQISYSSTGSQQIDLTACSSVALGCSGPQTSKAVRQAIYYAMDRTQINQLAYFGKGGPISPTYALPERDKQFISAQTADLSPMSPDTAKVAQLLEGDGWTKGADGIYAKGGERLSMDVTVTSGYTDYISTLEAMTQQLKAAGIELKVQQAANSEILSSTGLGKFQLTISSLYQGPVGDPYYVYNTFFNGKSTAKVGQSVNPYGNVARFSDPTVDAAIAAAAGTQDLKAKAAEYAKIQAVIVDEMPYIPVLNNTSFAEFNTTNYTGFPTFEDQYATAAPFSAPANGQVLMRLKAVKSK